MSRFVQKAVDVIVGIAKGVLIACIPPPLNFFVTTVFDLITGRISMGSVISNIVSSFTGFHTDIFGSVASSVASEVSVGTMDDCFSRSGNRARVQATDITLNNNLYNIKNSYYDRLHNDFTFNFQKKDNDYNDITPFINSYRTEQFNSFNENSTGFDILQHYSLPSVTKAETNFSKLIYNPMNKDDNGTDWLTMKFLNKSNDSSLFRAKKFKPLVRFDDL